MEENQFIEVMRKHSDERLLLYWKRLMGERLLARDC